MSFLVNLAIVAVACGYGPYLAQTWTIPAILWGLELDGDEWTYLSALRRVTAGRSR